MSGIRCALTVFSFSIIALSAANPTQIDDPKSFVNEVFRRFSSKASYTPPEDIYTARLGKLIRDDKKNARGEVGCVDFVFWLNAQDWTISKLAITSADDGPDRKTVIAKFRNGGEPQELHYDFRRINGRWLLDDVHSMTQPPWTLSELLKCAP